MANKKFIILLSFAVIASVALTIALFLRPTGSPSSAVIAAEPVSYDSLFQLDPTPGWRQGVTTETSMVIFDDDSVHACFVAVEYKPGTVDVQAELSRLRTQIEASTPGRSVKQLSTIDVGLEANGSTVNYQLYQSAVISPPGADKVKEGNAFGYAQLDDGFVSIEGSYDQPVQLTTLATPLHGLKINPR